MTPNADIAKIGDRDVSFADGLIRSIEDNPRRIPPRELHWYRRHVDARASAIG
jgi:hypothetical protein